MGGRGRALFFSMVWLAALPARANDVFLAQAASGSGSSCAAALAYTAFNDAASWTSGTPTGTQIGPGTTVHLCGTFDIPQGQTAFTFQGSGAQGAPVVLYFETGAVLQSPAFLGSPDHENNAGAIDLNGQSHLQINGGSACGWIGGALVPCNGLIQNTLNGSAGETCPAGPCSDLSDASTAFFDAFTTVSDVEIENLAIKSFYVRQNTMTDDGSVSYEIYFDHVGQTGVRIHNCDIENGSENVTLDFEDNSGSDLEIANNYLSDAHWTVAVVGASDDTTYTGIQIHDNSITNWSNWSIPSTDYHTNGTQIYNASCSSCSVGGGSAIYNNFFQGDLTGGQPTSSPTAILSLQDNAAGWEIFNNLIVNTCNATSYSCAASMWFLGPNAQNIAVYNNTIVDTGSGGAGIWAGSYPGTSDILIENNLIANVVYPLYINDDSWTEVTSDHNDFSGATDWACNNVGSGPPNCLTLQQYQSQQSQDLHSSSADPQLTGSYQLSAGSPAIGLGANLTSLGVAALDVDLLGVARPDAGAWDVGAYQYCASGSCGVTATASTGVGAATSSGSASASSIGSGTSGSSGRGSTASTGAGASGTATGSNGTTTSGSGGAGEPDAGSGQSVAGGCGCGPSGASAPGEPLLILGLVWFAVRRRKGAIDNPPVAR